MREGGEGEGERGDERGKEGGCEREREGTVREGGEVREGGRVGGEQIYENLRSACQSYTNKDTLSCLSYM